MAAKRCHGDNAEGLRKLINSVLDSDNDDSDFSENES
jgi:hypothetical protein